MSNYPNYVDNGIGLPVPRGPYPQKGVDMANFIVKVDKEQLITLCDQYLNDPTDGEYQYRPLFSHIIMTYSNLSGYVLDAKGQRIGWLPEIDFCFWIMTVAMKRTIGGIYIPSHIAWFPYTLFVDQAYGIATGREVFGFNKTIGIFDPPQTIQNPEFTVKTLGFKEFNPDQKGQVEWLAKVKRIKEPSPDDLPKTWGTGAEARQDIIDLLIGEGQDDTVADDWLEKAIGLLIHLIKPEVRLVFLKQFRSVADTTKAGFQAVVEMPVTVTEFNGGGFLQGEYEMAINYLASNPIAQELGIKLDNDKQGPLIGFWLDIDMTLENGEIIWKADI